MECVCEQAKGRDWWFCPVHGWMLEQQAWPELDEIEEYLRDNVEECTCGKNKGQARWYCFVHGWVSEPHAEVLVPDSIVELPTAIEGMMALWKACKRNGDKLDVRV